MSEPFEHVDMALLLAFEALLREGNLTRAARGLDITQPAMSARLTRLRRIFDDRLFVPAAVGRGVVATPRALTLAPMLEDALKALRRLVRSQRPFEPAASRRTFTIAMHDNPAMMVGPAIIRRVGTAAPGCRIALVTPDRKTISDDLEGGRIDVLIGDPEAVAPSLTARRYLAERFATAQRKGHPRGGGPIDLDGFCALGHLLVSADGGSFAGLVDETLARLDRQRRVSASVQSYALAPFVIEASDLVCTLPRRLLHRFGQTLDLFDPPVELRAFALSMIWHPRDQDDEGHHWLRGQLDAAARDLTA